MTRSSSDRHLPLNQVAGRYRINSKDSSSAYRDSNGDRAHRVEVQGRGQAPMSPIEQTNTLYENPRARPHYQRSAREMDARKETRPKLGKKRHRHLQGMLGDAHIDDGRNQSFPPRSSNIRKHLGGQQHLLSQPTTSLEEFSSRPRYKRGGSVRKSHSHLLAAYTWSNVLEELDRVETSTLSVLEEAQRIFDYREQQYEQAKGVESQLALYFLLAAESDLEIKKTLEPLIQQQKFLTALSGALMKSPHRQLVEPGWSLYRLSRQSVPDIKSLTMIQRSKYTPYSEGLGSYNVIHHKTAVVSASLEIMTELVQLLKSLHPHFKEYTGLLRRTMKTVVSLQEGLFTIQVRRHQPNKRQTIFNAFHHHFSSIASKTASLNKDNSRHIKQSRVEVPSMWSSANSERAFEILDKIKVGIKQLRELYVTEYMPVFMRRLDLMSAAELDRNMVLARRYWLTYWQTRAQNELRIKRRLRETNKIQRERVQVLKEQKEQRGQRGLRMGDSEARVQSAPIDWKELEEWASRIEQKEQKRLKRAQRADTLQNGGSQGAWAQCDKGTWVAKGRKLVQE